MEEVVERNEPKSEDSSSKVLREAAPRHVDNEVCTDGVFGTILGLLPWAYCTIHALEDDAVFKWKETIQKVATVARKFCARPLLDMLTTKCTDVVYGTILGLLPWAYYIIHALENHDDAVFVCENICFSSIPVPSLASRY